MGRLGSPRTFRTVVLPKRAIRSSDTSPTRHRRRLRGSLTVSDPFTTRGWVRGRERVVDEVQPASETDTYLDPSDPDSSESWGFPSLLSS